MNSELPTLSSAEIQFLMNTLNVVPIKGLDAAQFLLVLATKLTKMLEYYKTIDDLVSSKE